MPTVELGTFLVFLVAPFIAILLMKWLKGFGWPGMVIAGFVGLFGFVFLAALSLFMFSEYDVVQSTNVPQVSASASTIERDINGTVTSNTTKTAIVDPYVEQTPIIDSNHYEFGWLFSALSLLYGLLCFLVVFRA